MTRFEEGKIYKFGKCTKRTEKTAVFTEYGRLKIKEENGCELVQVTIPNWSTYKCYADNR